MNGSTYNFILDSDAYKTASHWNMYPKELAFINSYGECRNGSKWSDVVFNGLRPLIARLTGEVVTKEKVDEAFMYFSPEQRDLFNYDGWMSIVNDLGGKLPIEIYALPEGTIIGKSNAVIQIRNTVAGYAWVVGFAETMLSRMWYSIAVATKARETKKIIKRYMKKTCDEGENFWLVDYMLHDFGSRSASSYESSGIYGVAHKLIFDGTDTTAGCKFAVDFYNADPTKIIMWVPASEHSVMTINGREGEEAVLERLIETYPTGLLSVVDDSYDDNNFTTNFATKYKDAILARDGKFVFRPDSGDPVECVLRQLKNLGEIFGYTFNKKGFAVLNPKVGILWGDGIDMPGVEAILEAMLQAGWSPENIVFGMGGNLAHKNLDRDTVGWAFKACARRYYNEIDWTDVYKDPKNAGDDSSFTKASKRGVLKVVQVGLETETVRADEYPGYEDLLKLVFRDGESFYTEDDDWEACVKRARQY